MESPESYLAEHVRQVLLEDPRIREPELDVAVVAHRVVVTGTVHTQERRDAIVAVLAESFPDLECVNQTTVAALEAPAGEETLP